MTTVLIIDDEPMLRRALRASLAARGHHVLEAENGEAGVLAVTDLSPDLVVLDLGLPDVDGLDVLHRIRRISGTPVLVLTARDAPAQKVAALDAGADDYVTKPFDPAELLARVRAILRRNQPDREIEPVVAQHGVRIDLSAKTLEVGGAAVALTRTEWRLLSLFVTHPSRLLTHEYLLKAVWGPEYGHETNYLRTFIGQLRKKLADDAASPRFIVTEPGIGYRWIAEEQAADLA